MGLDASLRAGKTHTTTPKSAVVFAMKDITGMGLVASLTPLPIAARDTTGMEPVASLTPNYA
jgi:hypothetical protein